MRHVIPVLIGILIGKWVCGIYGLQTPISVLVISFLAGCLILPKLFRPRIKFRDARHVIEHEIAVRKAKELKSRNRRERAWKKTKQKKIDKLIRSLAKTVGPELMAVIQIAPKSNDVFEIHAPGFKVIRAWQCFDGDTYKQKWGFRNGNEFVYYDLESAMDSARILEQ